MWVKFENGHFYAEGIAPGPLPESPTRPVSFQYDVDFVTMYISVEIGLNYEEAYLDDFNITEHCLSAFKVEACVPTLERRSPTAHILC